MSHIPQRTEKDCLNCGTIVEGRYCQNCGQENVVPKETFWHMVTHFFYDITHFDSNFFHTLHHLVFKPGFLPKEYMRGKRASYIHPIKMYVFSSAMFFLLFFSVFQNSFNVGFSMPLTPEERSERMQSLQDSLKKDTLGKKKAVYERLLALLNDTTRKVTDNDLVESKENSFLLSFTDYNYKTVSEYDSMQLALPTEERDSWFVKRLVKKQIDVNNRYRENPDKVTNELIKSILHRLPYMLFVSLPLFALILRLVYIRRKQFYYADHGVFTIHLYVFTFILLMAVFGLDKLEILTDWSIWDFLQGLMFLGLFIYLLVAMKRFYGQRWFKTIIKFLIVSIISLVMMIILLLLFMFFSAVTF